MTKGERLKYLIKKSGYNNKTFAEKVGVNPNYISMLIKERQNISGNFIIKLKNQIPDVNLKWLEDGEGKPFELDDLTKITSNDSSIEIDKIVDLILANYEKFEQNKKFQLILETYSNKKLMEYLKKNS